MPGRDLIKTIREYGLSWFVWRSGWEISLRSGWMAHRLPRRDSPSELKWLAETDFPPHPRFAKPPTSGIFTGQATAAMTGCIEDGTRVAREAEDLFAGRWRYFSGELLEMGNPPDWFVSPISGKRWSSESHWTQIPDLPTPGEDIKYIWEPSRFSHVFQLVRAYATEKNDRYCELFWTHFESWCAANKPESGPNWRCGQELSLRVIVWVFGLYSFFDSPATTPGRLKQITMMICYHARHIAEVHWYAKRCLNSNHGISEAVALMTVGALFPDCPRSGHWLEMGTKSLTAEVKKQIYPDGTYIQHSTNYARLVVQLLSWVITLSRSFTIRLPEVVIIQARELLTWLVSLQNKETGRMLDYGPNDGALLFHLTNCDYHDFRPALNTLNLLVNDQRLYEPGPWDEEAVWLTGMDISTKTITRSLGKRVFADGGYYRLDGENLQAMIRCASYRHRPYEADNLHLTISISGQPVLIDAGTYLYNAPDEWRRYFAGTGAHNTIQIDQLDQMRRGRRWLWHNWTRSEVVLCDIDNDTPHFAGKHFSHEPLMHQRDVWVRNGTCFVRDTVTGDGRKHIFRLHWQLADLDLTARSNGGDILVKDGESLRLACHATLPGEGDWVRGADDQCRGWVSPTYGVRCPAWSFALEVEGESVTFLTLLGPRQEVEASLTNGWEVIQPPTDRT